MFSQTQQCYDCCVWMNIVVYYIYIYISKTSGWKTSNLSDSIIVKITEWAQAKCRYAEHSVMDGGQSVVFTVRQK